MEPFIYLASASSRRQSLLRQIGVGFDTIHPGVEEAVIVGEKPEDYVRRLARAKANAGQTEVKRQKRIPAFVLGADTCIVLDDEILGKPGDRAQGIDILGRLSGRSHEVLTGIALVFGEESHYALSRSRVKFRPLSNDDISDYWDTGEPVDKAGAYAIQGRAAGFIERIDGSYSGIVGLPLYELVMLLRKNGMKL